MKKIIMTLALTLFLFVGFGLMAYAEMAKEGSVSGIHYVITKVGASTGVTPVMASYTMRLVTL